jgi:hypothetical protein
MRIHGMDEPTWAKVEAALAADDGFDCFDYCISLVLVTLCRPTDPDSLPPGTHGLLRGLPYAALSLLIGWWGVLWGFNYTPLVVVTNFCGGCDITAEVRAQLQRSVGPFANS